MGNTIIVGDILSSNIPEDIDYIPAIADTVYTATSTCSTTQQIYGGAMGFVWKTPAAGSMTVGWSRIIRNVSSEYMVVNNGPVGTLFEFLGPYASLEVTLTVASAAGTWMVSRYNIEGWNYDRTLHDFSSQTGISDWYWNYSGTGAAFGAASHSKMSLITGTATTGRCAMASSYATYSGASGFGAALCEIRIGVSALSAVADEYILNVGLYGNDTGASTPLEGMFFRYDRLNYGVNWRYCYSTGSVISETDTGILVYDNLQYRLTTVVKADRTRADYYIDKAFIGSKTFAAFTQNKAMTAGIYKTAGTTSVMGIAEYAYFERLRSDR